MPEPAPIRGGAPRSLAAIGRHGKRLSPVANTARDRNNIDEPDQGECEAWEPRGIQE